MMAPLREAATPYLEQTVDLRRIDREAKAAAGENCRSMGGALHKMPEEVHPRTLMQWVRNEERHGKAGLADALSPRGNRASRYTPERRP